MMKQTLSWLLSAALILSMMAALPQPVEARIHGGIAVAGGVLPCQTYAGDNGCAAANQNGSYYPGVSLLTSAQQSGQTSRLPSHPMNFNIPGVDYPIGPDKTLTPQDPRNISDATCAYSAGANWVYCANTGTINYTLNNYDFCGSKIGKSNVQLYIGGTGGGGGPNIGSTFTVTNSYFCLAPGLNEIGWGGGNGPNWNIKFWNNQCDGGTADATAGFCLNDDVDAVGTSIDVRYNAFTNQGVGRVAGGMNFANWTFRYNYVNGLNTLNTGSHGELMQRNCGGGARSPCTPSDDYEGNFIVWDPTAFTGGNGNNSTVFPGDGASDAVSLSSFTFNDNIIVTNAMISGGNQPDQALFNSRLASMGTVTMTGNWVDASFSNDCSVSGVKSGGDTVQAHTSGNTLTVEATSTSFGNNPIEPGWFVIHSGFVTATITAYGTGGGNLGTYTFNGSPQTVGSDSLWTLVPGYSGTPTLAPNWNLAGSGAPVAMGLSGPQFKATHCSPGY